MVWVTASEDRIDDAIEVKKKYKAHIDAFKNPFSGKAALRKQACGHYLRVGVFFSSESVNETFIQSMKHMAKYSLAAISSAVADWVVFICLNELTVRIVLKVLLD